MPYLWNSSVNPGAEPLPIFIEKGTWHDADRENRAIPYKIYRPDDSGVSPPVIVWSHGLGGSRDGAGFISRFVASHGYVVVHIQHEGTDSGLWEGKPGHPWDIVRATHIPRRATLQRFRDVPFALDELEKMLAGAADVKRLGFCGHSFGAMTTQVMAGQYRGHGRCRYSLHEPRIKAGILYSPVPVRKKYGQPPDAFYGGIRIPLLTMTGTEDHSPLGDIDAGQRREVYDYSGGPEQSLLILQDGDHMIFNGSRGQLKANPKRGEHERIVKVLSLAFWDAWLKDDEAARAWLTGDGVRDWLDGGAAYEYKAPPS